MVKDKKEHLSSWLESFFKDAAFADCFLVEIQVDDTKERIQLWIDADKGLSLNRCAKINRALGNHLEEEGINYAIEVSSPGLDRPIDLLRQRKNNIGRAVRVIRKDQNILEGELKSVDSEKIMLFVEIPSNKRKKEYENQTIKESEIDAIYVLPQFNKKQLK